jgi:hypothetical protein
MSTAAPYVGRVVEIPPRYGRDQLLAVMVPIDEIERPVIEARNEAMVRSILILLLILPLYATLVCRLDRPSTRAPCRCRRGLNAASVSAYLCGRGNP